MRTTSWIKLPDGLESDPAVVSIAAAVGLAEDHVVGKLYRVWSWINRHSRSGTTRGATAAWLDRYVGCEGFAEAMRKASLLVTFDDYLDFLGHADRVIETPPLHAAPQAPALVSATKKHNVDAGDTKPPETTEVKRSPPERDLRAPGPDLTLPQVAKMLGVGRKKVDRWIKTQQLRATDVAEGPKGQPRWRISLEALKEFEQRRAFGRMPKEEPEKAPRRRRRRMAGGKYFPTLL